MWTVGPYPTKLPFGKRAAAGASGQSPAASPVNDPSPSQQIVSTAMQQAIFTNGRVDGVPALLLVDTGSAVTIIHRRLWEQGRGAAERARSKLQKATGGPIVAANGESLSILGQFRNSH